MALVVTSSANHQTHASGRPEESRGGPINFSDADYGDPVPLSRSAWCSGPALRRPLAAPRPARAPRSLPRVYQIRDGRR
jgi:hypothetical protein